MLLGGALARTMGHGEHSLAPAGRMNRDRDCDRMKRHHAGRGVGAAQAHVLRPFGAFAQVVHSPVHDVFQHLEP